jgi:hypothetical protein
VLLRHLRPESLGIARAEFAMVRDLLLAPIRLRGELLRRLEDALFLEQ